MTVTCIVCNGKKIVYEQKTCDGCSSWGCRCPFCGGAGIILSTDERYTACVMYIDQLDKDKRDKLVREEAHRRRMEEIKQGALLKLTVAEIEALGLV